MRRFIDHRAWASAPGVLLLSILGTIVVPFLLAKGQALSDWIAPDDMALQYKFTGHRVGNVVSWYLEIENSTDYAFDVTVNPPRAKVIRAAISKDDKGAYSWSGLVEKSEKMQLLYIFEETGARVSSDSIKDMISAKWDKRDSKSGATRKTDAVVREAGLISGKKLLGTVLSLVPVALICIILVLVILRVYRKKPEGTTPSSDGPA